MNANTPRQRIWLVTGASKGIGRHIAEAAAADGHIVIAGSRHPEAVHAWNTRTHGGEIVATRLDITSEESVTEVVNSVVERWGRVDVLVNNAGYLLYGGVEELSDQEALRSFDVNLFGLLTVIRRVLPVMRAQKAGRIINMASISANITAPGVGLYSATKAAVLLFSEALAAEATDLGIHTTAICPGGVRTDFLDASSAARAQNQISDYAGVHQVEDQLSQANHKQGGDPEKVAHAIVKVAAMDAPPARLYLGDDAIEGIRHNVRSILDDVDTYEALSRSITYTPESSTTHNS